MAIMLCYPEFFSAILSLCLTDTMSRGQQFHMHHPGVFQWALGITLEHSGKTN